MKAQESNGLRRFLNKGVEATDSPPAEGPEVEPFAAANDRRAWDLERVSRLGGEGKALEGGTPWTLPA